METKSKRGGYRPGCGRPCKDTEVLYLRTPVGVKDRVKVLARERGITPGEFVADLLNQYDK